MALSEVVKELKFIVQFLQTMNIEVELPISMYVDKVRAIWPSNNRTTSDRAKHIDIRTSFVKEYQEDGKRIIKFVKSEDNEADIFTKNVGSPQVPFLMCTLEIPQKLQHKFFALNFCYLYF